MKLAIPATIHADILNLVTWIEHIPTFLDEGIVQQIGVKIEEVISEKLSECPSISKYQSENDGELVSFMLYNSNIGAYGWNVQQDEEIIVEIVSE